MPDFTKVPEAWVRPGVSLLITVDLPTQAAAHCPYEVDQREVAGFGNSGNILIPLNPGWPELALVLIHQMPLEYVCFRRAW